MPHNYFPKKQRKRILFADSQILAASCRLSIIFSHTKQSGLPCCHCQACPCCHYRACLAVITSLPYCHYQLALLSLPACPTVIIGLDPIIPYRQIAVSSTAMTKNKVSLSGLPYCHYRLALLSLSGLPYCHYRLALLSLPACPTVIIGLDPITPYRQIAVSSTAMTV